MSQANEPITLKIHHGDDIRRFHLSQLDWSELTQLLSSHYPIPHTLKYRDMDNDMVTMVTQHDLQDAMEMSQGGILHLYIFDKEMISASTSDDIKSTASAPNLDMKSSSDDDIISQLSHEEISTLVQECLSDPIVINAIPPFLTTFVDQLTINMSTSTPLSTSWSQSLQQHPTIRDHVILSVLLPRLHQSLNQADNKQMATRIPSHLLPMIKGWIPMLPMFLPSIVPMMTKFMSQSNTSDTQTQDLFASSPLASMLGPMLSGLQQPTSASTSTSASASASSATSTTAPSPNDSSATSPNPFALLAPLLAGAAANPSTTNNNPQTNPLLGLLGPLLAANAANTTNSGNPSNPFASWFQPPSHTNSNTNTNTNTTTTTTNTIPDYTQQLNQLESMNLGSRDLNLSLLKQWNGDVERVMEFLTTME